MTIIHILKDYVGYIIYTSVQAHGIYTLFYTKYIKLWQNYYMIAKTNDKVIV